MSSVAVESSRQIRERFLSGQTISIEAFYGQYDSALLLRLLAGWERDFDLACAGDRTRQPFDWLQDRLALIARILAERNHSQAEQMGNSVRSKLAKPIAKFNH